MDDKKWLLLNQLLEDISDKSFVSEDSIRLVSQLVLELESELTSIKLGNSLPLVGVTSWTNHEKGLA